MQHRMKSCGKIFQVRGRENLDVVYYFPQKIKFGSVNDLHVRLVFESRSKPRNIYCNQYYYDYYRVMRSVHLDTFFFNEKFNCYLGHSQQLFTSYPSEPFLLSHESASALVQSENQSVK